MYFKIEWLARPCRSADLGVDLSGMCTDEGGELVVGRLMPCAEVRKCEGNVDGLVTGLEDAVPVGRALISHSVRPGGLLELQEVNKSY